MPTCVYVMHMNAKICKRNIEIEIEEKKVKQLIVFVLNLKLNVTTRFSESIFEF